MIDLYSIVVCGWNIFCHVDKLTSEEYNKKYPKDVAQLCYYFEEQKAELPDYCKMKSEVKPPRRRSDF